MEDELVYLIEWTYQARDDLQAIYDYISRDSPRYAEQTIDRILIRVEQLRHFPLTGGHLEEFVDLPYRQIFSRIYRIVYRVDEDRSTVYICAVVHGSRNFPPVFEQRIAELNDKEPSDQSGDE